jgi:hypothetical protein
MLGAGRKQVQQVARENRLLADVLRVDERALTGNRIVCCANARCETSEMYAQTIKQIPESLEGVIAALLLAPDGP